MTPTALIRRSIYLILSAFLIVGCPDSPDETGELPEAFIEESLPASPSSNNRPRMFGTADVNTVITFYASPDCTTDILGAGPSSQFTSPTGIEIEVPENAITTIYAAARLEGAGENGKCSEGFEYEEDSKAPLPPSLISTMPPSPANFNSPSIIGSTEPNISVFLFLTSDCSGDPEKATDADSKGMFSFSYDVPDDSTTKFYANAMDFAGNTSDCSASIEYREDSTGPTDAVVVTNSDPISPSQNAMPLLSGSADGDIVRVKLFSDAACLDEIADGDVATFTGAGLPSNVPENATTEVYARGLDALDNEGPCSSSGFTYTHDSIAPDPPELWVKNPGNSNVPAIWATTDIGNTVRVYPSPDCTGSPISGTVTDGSGVVIISGHFVPSNTSTQFSATTVDQAGNLSGCTDPLDYTEDSIPPAMPTLSFTAPPSPSFEQAPVVHGVSSGNAAGYIQLYAGTSDHSCPNSPVPLFRGYGPVSVEGEIFSDNFAIQIDPQFPTGTTYYIRAKAYDKAGNSSGCSSDVLEFRVFN